MKNIMKEAHNLTKKIIRKGDSYKATFRICLSFVHSQVKKGVNKMGFRNKKTSTRSYRKCKNKKS